MKNYILKILFCLSLIFLIQVQIGQASTGTIDSSSHSALVCHDATCATPTPGSINWKPTTGTAVSVDSVIGLSGQIWGNELGWIDLHPTGQGVTFASPTTGVLTGKAWSQVSGWINFAPTGQGVTINPSTGEFSGWAWTGGPEGGWIKFDCGSPSSCVKTSWRGSSSSSGNGGSSQQPDVCPNIALWQTTIPSGYTIDSSGSCIYVADVCPNIDGSQETIPSGYIFNNMGACVPKNIDFCPNITGIQLFPPLDYIVTVDGNCMPKTKDICPNLHGIQDDVPTGFRLENGLCLFNYTPSPISISQVTTSDVLAYPFIPKKLQIPSSNKVIKEIVNKLGFAEHNQVDLTSVFLSFIALLILIYLLIRLFKLFL